MKRLVPATLLLSALIGCSARDTGPATPGSGASTTTAGEDARYLIYLHPKVVEDQGLPATSPEHGDFQYDAILDAFRQDGFTVLSEQRPKGADSQVHARRTVAEMDRLLAAGVKPGHITVVGASKGSYIASLASHFARNPEINYVILAGCMPDTVDYMRDNGIDLYGNILEIRDVADTHWAGPCADVLASSPGVRRHKEIVVTVGTGHGIIFEPLEAWVGPTKAWARSGD